MTRLLDGKTAIIYGAGGHELDPEQASERAGAITGTIVNASCGLVAG